MPLDGAAVVWPLGKGCGGGREPASAKLQEANWAARISAERIGSAQLAPMTLHSGAVMGFHGPLPRNVG